MNLHGNRRTVCFVTIKSASVDFLPLSVEWSHMRGQGDTDHLGLVRLATESVTCHFPFNTVF
jgi:polyribonucleotide nucleotidyltransferase